MPVGTFAAARPTTKGSFLEYLRALRTGELDAGEVCGLGLLTLKGGGTTLTVRAFLPKKINKHARI